MWNHFCDFHIASPFLAPSRFIWVCVPYSVWERHILLFHRYDAYISLSIATPLFNCRKQTFFRHCTHMRCLNFNKPKTFKTFNVPSHVIIFLEYNETKPCLMGVRSEKYVRSHEIWSYWLTKYLSRSCRLLPIFGSNLLLQILIIIKGD